MSEREGGRQGEREREREGGREGERERERENITYDIDKPSVFSTCSNFSAGQHEGASGSGEEVGDEVPGCGSQKADQGEGGLRCGKTVSAAMPGKTRHLWVGITQGELV